MKPTIWLAEDDRNDVFLFKHALKGAQVEVLVEVIHSGAEVIERLEKMAAAPAADADAPPLALFLDLKLPRGNGFEVLEWLSRQTALNEFPVFVLSASEEPADVTRTRELGAADYLVKPPTSEQLDKLLGELVSGDRTSAESEREAH